MGSHPIQDDVTPSGPLDRVDTDPSAPDRAETDPSGSRSAPDRRPTNPSEAPRKRAETALDRKPAPTGDKRSKRRSLPDEHVGKTLNGKYRIDKLIAKGGMGRVYKATQYPLERPVAIKILNADYQRSDPQFIKRFFMEAAIAAKLSHPHTITVFDYGEGDGGELFIAMELLKGLPLSRVISKHGPFDPLDVLRVGMQVCRALREAHEAGIIHRDLKPGNIFILDDGGETPYAKVLDFGLVKLFTPDKSGDDEDDDEEQGSMLGAGDPELTRTGTLLGSPKYMSPEQIQGIRLDPRTDIYSFGVILYQMACGKPPFTGATGVDVIYKHVNHPVPAIASMNPDVNVPPELEEIIQRCLKKDRDERYGSMNELLAYLKEALGLLGNASDSLSGMGSGPRSRDPAMREASFREVVDEPTPTGLLAADVSGPQPTASKAPVVLAGIGFLVALLALAYVLTSMPERTQPVAPVAPAKAEAEAPAKAPPPVPAPPVEQTPADPPDDEPPPGELEDDPTPTTAKKATAKKKKRKKRAKSAPATTTKPKDEKKPGTKVDLAPTYRDNPY